MEPVVDDDAAPEGAINFPAEEVLTLQYWESIDAFKTSVQLSEGKPEYTFYDGPPFATGLPHYGHILAGTIKDTVTRYAHQTGHYVSRRFGWDCHGLPVEYEIDKMLGLTSRDEVLAMGIDKYNDHCRSIVQRYTGEWETVVTRLGRWIDFKNDYRTMDTSFMESVWWVFKTMHSKGLVYRGYKVMPYSTACSTPLSNFEAGLNYKDVTDPAVVVSFPLVDDPAVSLVAWTTTPWTLPSNLALCVNAMLVYVKVKSVADGKVYIVAEARLVQLFPALAGKKFKAGTESTIYEVLASFPGSELVGKKYEPLFGCFDNAARRKTCWRVVADAYVTSDAGTGIVHQAPAFGEDDYRVCAANDVFDVRAAAAATPDASTAMPCPIDANGRFTEEVCEADLVGLHVKAADSVICAKLKAAGRLVSKDNYLHSYPFCWRSDTPLIYKAVPSWFVAVETFKDRLLANNEQTHWVPAMVKEKRFRNWLADAKDWAISRNRFWGTPIPLWTSEDGEEVIAVGSVAELRELLGEKGQELALDDLHRHHVDHLEIPSPTRPGVMLRRVDEVFDCWFESGSMPYAQLHYPFECKETDFEKKFPADFIAEGLDQTRGWFYTLMVISTALFDKPAFKNLIVNGLVLAGDGKKMSKRLKNYPDPTIVIDAHGSDALRLYLINSPVVKGETLKFQQEGVKAVLRDVMLPWFNAYRFFAQQALRWEQNSGQGFVRDENKAQASSNTMDKWIRANLEGLVEFVHQEMRAYRLYTVVPRLLTFLGDLTNYYVRLNRARLKGQDGDADAQTSLAVLFEVLLKMAVLMAPFTPFFAEYVYQRLRKRLPEYARRGEPGVAADCVGAADSVHYLMLPVHDATQHDDDVIAGMRLLQQVLELGRRARETAKLSMKCPVARVVVVSSDARALAALKNELEPYVLDELNAWSAELTTDLDAWCTLSALPNLKLIAKKLGARIKPATEAIKALDSGRLREYLKTGALRLDLADGAVDLGVDELIVKTEFAATQGDIYAAQTTSDGATTVAIDTRQDDALRSSAIARDLCNRVNKLRKKAKLVVGEPIDVYYVDDDSAGLATAGAILANASVMDKANIVAMPLDAAATAAAIAFDVLPTPYGSDALRVVLCKPFPALSVAAKAKAGAQAAVLASLVSSLAPASLDRPVSGTLDGVAFNLTVGTDIFHSATLAYKAQ